MNQLKKQNKAFIKKNSNKTLKQLLQLIKTRHTAIKKLSNSQLQNLSYDLRQKLKNNTNLDHFLIEAYALVYESCIRILNIQPYDVQILGAIALHFGNVVEMQTGEGKTLTAVFPAYLNALNGKGTHILTFNDYLAKRDAEWMSPVYTFLGLSVGYIIKQSNIDNKKEAYNCDITYATAKDAGFDYLRSTLAYSEKDIVQRPFNFAIIDEADAILIDEARNPLVLSGDVTKTKFDFYEIARFVSKLGFKTHFNMDAYRRNVYLTEEGAESVEKTFNMENLYDEKNLEFHAAINQALQARVLLKKNVDYIVKNDKIKIIDEFTGRIMNDRKWKDGLQLAVEAKEQVALQKEGKILNMITLPHFLEKYPKISGMTATARQSIEEFFHLYQLDTIVIPPNKACKRTDLPDLLFTNKDAKLAALLYDVKKIHETKQPILIGTLTVKESEEIAATLKQNDIACNILNAKNDEHEASVIADAGMPGAVTISTNMAGRGTDILLGGKNGTHKEMVINTGGLFVIGTNIHESSRVDNQLRGRAGRQGDIGISQFYISYEDDLMIRYKLMDALPKKYKDLETNVKKDNKLREYFAHVQRIIEGQMFDLRKMHFEYSALIEKQRMIIFEERLKYLDNSSIQSQIHLITGTEQLDDDIDFLEKARTIILFQYDKYWSQHLDYLSEVKEGIGLLRIGKQNPLREFQKHTDQYFMNLCKNIDQGIHNGILHLLQNKNMDLAEAGIKKPSSIWTYIVNDHPFGNNKGFNLTNSGYLGF